MHCIDSGLLSGNDVNPQYSIEQEEHSQLVDMQVKKLEDLSKISVILPANRPQLCHIFCERDGHLPDTPENRQTLIDLANDPTTFSGIDLRENIWHSKILQDGTQLWVQYRNGIIINGGKNNLPRNWDDLYGLNQGIIKKGNKK